MEVTVINKDNIADILHRFTIGYADLALHALRQNLSKKEQRNMPQRIMPNEENSPIRCPVPNQKDQFILYYPAHSKPYPFRLDGMSKECYILLGEIHESNKNTTYTRGKHFLIPPDQVYKPYTTDSISLALIIIRPPDFNISDSPFFTINQDKP